MSNGSRAPAERKIECKSITCGQARRLKFRAPSERFLDRGGKAPDSWAFLLFRIRHLSSLGITRSSKVFFLFPGISPYWEQSLLKKIIFMHLQRVKIITETRKKKYKKSCSEDLTFYDKVLHLGDREFTEV